MKTRAQKKASHSVSAAKRSRGIPDQTSRTLYVRAGGRCQFRGCNDYLLDHHITKERGNFAQRAHIRAFQENGPRGEPEGKHDPHDVENLMLLCPKCHKLIDDNPTRYTVEKLKRDKRDHEARIHRLTGMSPDLSTVAVVLRGRIAGDAVSIDLPEIRDAVLPRYVGERDVYEIDLTGINDSGDPSFWSTAAGAIRSRMQRFYECPFDEGPARHVSVFALAPIPLLMTLGSCLSDKVPTALYQRHRDTEGWSWQDNGPEHPFRAEVIQEGDDPTKVAVIASVSGRLGVSDLPAAIDGSFTVYHIEPEGCDPGLGVLGTDATLQAFRRCFRGLMRTIDANHPGLAQINMFPAVPAPCAVAMGRDLLPKRDPGILVHDYDKAAGGFVPTLEINQK